MAETYQATLLKPLDGASKLLLPLAQRAALEDMALASEPRDAIRRVLREYERRTELAARGLRHAYKLLFVGPPGVGKTMAAGAIARATALPLFRVELHGVIGSHMGETAAHLYKVFDHIWQVPAVYLFDEVDAIGSSRTTNAEGADREMQRATNSLLQFIEDDRSASSIMVATTNLAGKLDKALFRRFDQVVTFGALDAAAAYALIRHHLRDECDFDIDGATSSLCVGYGHADLVAALMQVRKDHLLDGTPIDDEHLVATLKLRTQHRETP